MTMAEVGDHAPSAIRVEAAVELEDGVGHVVSTRS